MREHWDDSQAAEEILLRFVSRNTSKIRSTDDFWFLPLENNFEIHHSVVILQKLAILFRQDKFDIRLHDGEYVLFWRKSDQATEFAD